MRQILKKIIISILTLEARLVLLKYRPKIIAVTGSVGKTSTKDAIFAVFAAHDFVRKSEKSFNSDIGIPLTILGLPNGWYDWRIWFSNIIEGAKLVLLKNHYPRRLVLEVGADRPGDIRSVARWLKPDAVVVTRFSKMPVHVEFFDSPEALLEEKATLVEALKTGGILVLNYDDPDAMHLKEKAKSPRLVTYGSSLGARIRATENEIMYATDADGRRLPTGMRFHVSYIGNTAVVQLYGVVGRQYVAAALAALSLGITAGISITALVKSLGDLAWPLGRLALIPGKNNSLLLDDTYNSSPIAVEAALETLRRIEAPEGGRKIAVLGDMLELGKYTSEAHRHIGWQAAFADMVLGVGMRAENIIRGAEDNGIQKKAVLHVKTAEEAGEFLSDKIMPGDIILIKGSQNMRMERAVKMLMAYPEDAEKLLVRQEAVWEEK